MRYSGIEKLDARLREARKRTKYVLVHMDTSTECSAERGDYDFHNLRDSYTFTGYSLVKKEHPYITRTGLMVFAPLVLKYNPTMRDLRRIYRAKENL